MFLETLVDFITVHREDLQDWLFVLLTQLLKKMGADLLGSVQAKVQKALDITRSETRARSQGGGEKRLLSLYRLLYILLDFSFPWIYLVECKH